MSLTKHVAVVLDLNSGFPAAKLASSTNTDKVISILIELSDTYGNPAICILQKIVVFPSIIKKCTPSKNHKT